MEEISNSQEITILRSFFWDESAGILKLWWGVLIESSYGESRVRIRFLNQKLCFVKKKNPERNLLEAITVTKIFQPNLAGMETENSGS